MSPGQPPSGRSRPPRFQHRSRSHASAHSESADAHAHHPHPLATADKPELVTRPDELAALLDHLREAKSFAYDSEFIGELTYVPKLCLIQVATSSRIALIDPLAELDLSGFWRLIADPGVEKIVHAGQQDVEPVFRAIDHPPANLFDTQIAAGFIGLGYPLALSKLVFNLIGAKLSKGLTFTHWDQRPLTDHQLIYAANDVRYLPAARHEIGARLTALGHAAWASEESNNLADPALYKFDPETQWLRIRGASSLPAKNQAVLRELMTWREQAAMNEDVPPRSMLRDEILLDLARNPINSVSALARVRGLPRPVESAHGQAILEATRKALALPVEMLPDFQNREPSPPEKFRADSLFAAAQCIAAGQQIDPSLLASRQEIGELHRLLTAKQSPDDLRVMKGWRRKAMGEKLLSLMEGKASFGIHWSGDSLTVK